MVIGIDASRANKKNKTGTEWYSYYIIQEMKKIADSQDRFVLYSKDILKGVLHHLPVGWQSKVLKWPFKFFWTQGRLSLEMIYKSPDLLFVPAHTIPLVGGKKTVTVIHDIGFEEFPELYGSLELMYHRWSAKLAKNKADLIITPSQFTKDKMVDIYGSNPEKIKVVHHGYNQDIFHNNYSNEEGEKVVKKYNINKPFLITTSRLEKKKNILGLIKAFQLLLARWPNLNLVLVGDPGHGYDEIEEKIYQYGLNKNIIQTGWLSSERIGALYSQALAFVFPTFYEGFGLPILEAQACGCPVVVSKVASCPEVGGKGAWYMDPYNPRQMAQKIGQVIEDAAIRDELIAKGLKNVKQFSWEKAAEETLEILLGC